MGEVLSGRIPEETDATCDNCAMCTRNSQPHSSEELFYNPETKCCTYIPTLPNFIVGGILGDGDAGFAAGRVTVEARLRAGIAVTPLGLGMPPTFGLLYSRTGPQTFGLSKTLRCPHYLVEEGGRCGVWKHRAAVCATWYCKYVRGAVSAKFWKLLHQLLSTVEESLSRWCIYELDVGVEALGLLFPIQSFPDQNRQLDGLALDGKFDRTTYAMAWGKWLGHEQEFYREAARLVKGLHWRDIIAIGGSELKICEQLVRDAYGKLTSNELPPFLKVGTMNVLQMGHDSFRVTTYSPIDPIEVRKSVMAVLPYFDGGPISKSTADIEEREGVKLSQRLVRKLVDFEILIPPKTPMND